MSTQAYLFLGLTAIVAALAGSLAFTVLRLFAAARDGGVRRSPARAGGFLTTAGEPAVSGLRAEERALKARAEASERLSSSIITSLTSGLLVVSESGIVQTLNPAGAAMLGLDGTVGTSYREALQATPALADAIGECLRSGKAIVRRAVPVGAGSTSHLGLSASPIRSPHGPQGAICLFADLTEVIELEEQLRLQDSLARLGELTAGIAHEFRNGLATIHGYARLLDLDGIPADARRYVEGIREETDALGQIVARFLNFARPVQLVLTQVDLGAVCRKAADEIRADAEAHGGCVQISGDFGQVSADEVLLKQALSNLCRNALESCLDAHVPPQIAIAGTSDKAHRVVRVTVEDNGPGIDEAKLPKLFQPFFTTKAKGTGLGLALVQKIVVCHNGRIVAGRSGGHGARFEITLPSAVA
jgi:nitrogen fixation/metabolism regulation signal transduction histidine kinase